jgi:hypothetical protein
MKIIPCANQSEFEQIAAAIHGWCKANIHNYRADCWADRPRIHPVDGRLACEAHPLYPDAIEADGSWLAAPAAQAQAEPEPEKEKFYLYRIKAKKPGRYHRTDCKYKHGAAMEPLAEILVHGGTPCHICQPDKE